MSPKDNNNDKPSVLKTTREAKGLTLEIVHEATKIPMDALRAIEEGYSSRILSPFYFRGFIKIYSEFLGLDVKEIYKQYGVDEPSHKPLPKPGAVAAPSHKPQRKEPQPNLFLEQAQESFASVLKPKNLRLIFKIAGFLVLVFVLFKIGGCVVSHLHQKAPAAGVVHRKFEQETPAARVVAPAAKQRVVQAPSQNKKVEVAVRAFRNIWLRVRADDRVVYETILSKGSLESWTANKRIELSGRDLQRLDMEVNYKHIGFLGGGRRRISRVVITPEGLTVKK
ncbi:MAG: helix-turn-helix domain-containing protein [Candidatus Omnitrophica bacterium]|nr:helix-turn-helix domain-containing protein [Candidatus Omnitrophota bacterium]MDE2009786.1 helix-turn-helix domain-containing protein [Candidatus Omnitrophota bacterium]MDE2215131.1 helix-turn-helix domain-containing protein [Candidatus Omnitrophota bacterium]MDE2231485.1 helix-turn-helix domain-containing protein [Candidatus Omnitrophota bacterium]